jgi:hypothetical protein
LCGVDRLSRKSDEDVAERWLSAFPPVNATMSESDLQSLVALHRDVVTTVPCSTTTCQANAGVAIDVHEAPETTLKETTRKPRAS